MLLKTTFSLLQVVRRQSKTNIDSEADDIFEAGANVKKFDEILKGREINN